MRFSPTHMKVSRQRAMEMAMLLIEELATLTPRQLFIFTARCPILGGKRKTLAAIALDVGVSSERVRQIYAKTERNLRSQVWYWGQRGYIERRVRENIAKNGD